jgi:periplasmic divalent cation tolerance protein
MAEVADDTILVLSTVESEAEAERMVQELVEARLVACGNVIPGVASIYRWRGEVARHGEVLVLMKTTRARVEELFERAARIHPYEVPELIAVPINGGFAPYRQWVADETSKTSA